VQRRWAEVLAQRWGSCGRSSRAHVGEHLVRIHSVSGIVLRDPLRERREERAALVVVEILEFLPTDRDKIHHCTVGQFGGFVEHEVTVPYVRL